MFSVNIERMADGCVQLERLASETDQLHMELEAAIRALRSLSNLDEQINRLKTQKSQLEAEQTGLKHMMLGLDKITLDYISCENRICDYGEQSVIRYGRREIGISDLGEISNILGTIPFE